VALVVLSGEHDLASAGDLAGTLTAALRRSTHLVIDLRNAKFIDSSTMRVMLIAKHEADAAECRFNLLLGTAKNIETAIIETALDVSGLNDALNRVQTLDEALAANRVG
jgi:anti-anti-sigma factor